MEKYRRITPQIYERVFTTEIKSGDVAVGAVEDHTITPPTGYKIRLLTVAFTANNPVGATAGTHIIYIYNGSHNTELGIRMSRAYSNGLMAAYNDYIYSSATCFPNDRVAAIMALQSLIAATGESIKFRYHNDTDAIQTNNRTWRILYELIPVS